MIRYELTRRQLLRGAGAVELVAAAEQLLPAYLWAEPQRAAPRDALPALSGNVINLAIGEMPCRVGSKASTAMRS